MGFFSFFKKRTTVTDSKDRSALTPVTILRAAPDYLPARYKNQTPYIDYLQFMKHHEFGLALDSLVQLADESGHYFPENFWLDMAACAGKLGMTAEADHCKQQIRRNKLDNVEVPEGATAEIINGQVVLYRS